MASINIPINNGTGSQSVANGNYNVTVTSVGYDVSTLNPSTINVVDGTNDYSFTVGATGTLTIHVSDDGTATGKLTGTSNVFFAKEFNLTPIGTMSHQVISFEECVSGVFECNYNMMQKWADVYNGDLGIYLCDCFGNKAFFNNFSKDVAKLFDGLRIDSGDEKEETEMVMERYKELGIDPSTKSIVYSNALTIDKAIELHNWVGKRLKDSYGIGTYLMADVTSSKTKEKFPYSNIVIKLTRMRLTESREWHDCVKLSCDKGKTLGDREKCEFLVKELSH